MHHDAVETRGGVQCLQHHQKGDWLGLLILNHALLANVLSSQEAIDASSCCRPVGLATLAQVSPTSLRYRVNATHVN
jgi:hypothetical protein